MDAASVASVGSTLASEAARMADEERCVACGQLIVRTYDGPLFTGWRHLMPKHEAVPAPEGGRS